MSFQTIVYGPTLPRSLDRLRTLLGGVLTTSRSQVSTAAAIGYYCTATELRPVVATLLKATAASFVLDDHQAPVVAFAQLKRSSSIFYGAIRELETLGVDSVLTELLVRHFDEESPVHGLAAASVTLFLALRIV